MLGAGERGEASDRIRARVERARERQRERGVTSNARATGRWMDRHGKVSTEARALLATGAERLGLSARGYHRVLKVARTIADLDGDATVGAPAIAEALRYRPSVSAPEGA
jgi:magnesium chelatase family protein